jgi:23S rRNA pseudouridine1911/1915/1917 synthase
LKGVEHPFCSFLFSFIPNSLKIIESILVKEVSDSVRLYDYLTKSTHVIPSRKGTKKALKKGRVRLNELLATGSEFVKNGDLIEVQEEEAIVKKVFPSKINVWFEDEHLAIVEKPAGIPTSGNYYKTLLNTLPFNLTNSKENDALPCPLPIHRLDKLTAGLVIIAKTYASRIELGKMLENREIHKSYRAIVHREINGFGLLNSPIDGKSALSSFRCFDTFVTKRFGDVTLVELSPLTGRTHQLRIHMSRLGFPIIGDKMYVGNIKTPMDKGLFLQAFSVEFKHPVTKTTIAISLQQPNKFNWIMK